MYGVKFYNCWILYDRFTGIWVEEIYYGIARLHRSGKGILKKLLWEKLEGFFFQFRGLLL